MKDDLEFEKEIVIRNYFSTNLTKDAHIFF